MQCWVILSDLACPIHFLGKFLTLKASLLFIPQTQSYSLHLSPENPQHLQPTHCPSVMHLCLSSCSGCPHLGEWHHIPIWVIQTGNLGISLHSSLSLDPFPLCNQTWHLSSCFVMICKLCGLPCETLSKEKATILFVSIHQCTPRA